MSFTDGELFDGMTDTPRRKKALQRGEARESIKHE